MESQLPPPDVKSRLKASYDAMAPAYNDWTVRHHALRLKYLEKLYAACPGLLRGSGDASAPAPVVLELGCGAGVPVLSELLGRNAACSVIANDLSETQMGLAAENLAEFGSERVRFVPGDMTLFTAEKNTSADNGWYIAPGSLTAVIGLYSIIHLPQAEQAAMISAIAAWLEPGGCLLANFSATEVEGIVMEKWIDDKGWMFWSGLGVEGTVGLMEAAGLRVEHRVVEEGPQETFLWLIVKKDG